MESALNLPPLIASRYIPVRLIGKGGMGVVYEVEHARTGEHLALKLLLSGLGTSPEAVERFKREARASARIKSEYVVRVTDADVAIELQGAPFLVMELLEGMDLEQACAASAPLPETVVAWLRQVAQAIDKAHRLGIIHRDLKPENLFLAAGDGGRVIVKVLDFGIAKMLEEGTGVTGAGQMLGTPKYMSPEQATPNAPVTPATDYLALGLIAYRLLVGESYYQGGAMAILGEILHGELQPPSARGSRLGDAFDAWFLKACHRDPEQRFASASEQIEALAEVLGRSRSEGEVTLPGAADRSAARSAGHSRPRRPPVVAGLMVAGLAAVALAGLLLHRRGDESGAVPTAAGPGASVARPVQPPSPVAEPPPVPPATTNSSGPVAGSVAAASGPGAERRVVVRRHVAGAPSVAREKVPKKGAQTDPTETAPAPAIDPYAEQK